MKNFGDCGRKKIESLFVNKVGKMEEKDYGWGRGETSERKFFLALEELKKEGAFKDFGQSFRFSQEDLKKKDFCIVSNEGKIIWFQIKTSFNANDKEKYLRKGIQYIAIEDKNLGEIKAEILEILSKAKKPKPKRKIEVQIP